MTPGPPICIRDSEVTVTGVSAAKLILLEILDLKYGIQKYWTANTVEPRIEYRVHSVPFSQLTDEEKRLFVKRQTSKLLKCKDQPPKRPPFVYPAIVFCADLGGDNFIKIVLVKRPVDEVANSEMDDRWYPAFAMTSEEAGLLERFFILHFSDKDIHAYQVPPKIIGYTEVKKELSDERLHNVEPNRRRRPKVKFKSPPA